MSSHKVGLDSYVEIALCMADQDNYLENLRQSVSNYASRTVEEKSITSWSPEEFEIHSPHFLKKEWRDRIADWQEQYPGNGTAVEDTSLTELQFSMLFLQHPFAAMSLWNVMQRFYALDRVVCSTSKESLEKIREWEEMAPFKYLEAGKVEERWRSSLQDLGKEIKDSSRQADTLLPSKDKGLSDLLATRKNTKDISRTDDNVVKNQLILKRIDGLYSGIAKLDSALHVLRRNLGKYLENVDLMEIMLERVVASAGIRYSMIDTCLKVDENIESGVSVDCQSNDTQIPNNTSTPSPAWPQPGEYINDEVPRGFKPLSRSNSMDIVKNRLVIAWVSTRRGDATASAILLLIIVLGCLIQIQRYLIAGSEFGATTP